MLVISFLCRDGVEWFFVKLHEKKVPVLIISGGLGGIWKLQSVSDTLEIKMLNKFESNVLLLFCCN